MEKKPSRRKLHRKLREKSEADGEFQNGEYEEPESEDYEIAGDHELDPE